MTDEHNFTPIGGMKGAFGGVFDGNDHTICNLQVDNSDSDFGSGLFGAVVGTVCNLKVTGTVFGGENTGGRRSQRR
ncbi:MAG: hypothetical protein IKN17_12365 [Ruminococcus sp.]|nr:hypothetical protein [Ruminococcus sp.]